MWNNNASSEQFPYMCQFGPIANNTVNSTASPLNLSILLI